jgi:hypothetical protein
MMSVLRFPKAVRIIDVIVRHKDFPLGLLYCMYLLAQYVQYKECMYRCISLVLLRHRQNSLKVERERFANHISEEIDRIDGSGFSSPFPNEELSDWTLGLFCWSVIQPAGDVRQFLAPTNMPSRRQSPFRSSYIHFESLR